MEQRLDTDEVARILRRAHTIEARSDSAGSGGVSPDALVAAAAEVGFDPDAVRDAVAIERLEISVPEPRTLDGLAGPGTVVVERELLLESAEALDRIEAWLVSAHRLRCARSADRLRADRRVDTSARVGRFLSGLRGEGRLGNVRSLEVEATSLHAGATCTLVRIRVDRSADRQTRLGGGLAVVAAGLASAVLLAAEALAAFPAVAIPSAAAGLLVARTGRGQADRVTIELEHLLSAVDRGERPSGLLSRAARRLVG